MPLRMALRNFQDSGCNASNATLPQRLSARILQSREPKSTAKTWVHCNWTCHGQSLQRSPSLISNECNYGTFSYNYYNALKGIQGIAHVSDDYGTGITFHRFIWKEKFVLALLQDQDVLLLLDVLDGHFWDQSGHKGEFSQHTSESKSKVNLVPQINL